MSDTMLLGVLRMPYELAMSTELSRRQFYERALEAADRIAEAVQPTQERKPLTESQVANVLWAAHWPEVLLSDFVKGKLRELIRAVEAEHGIVAQPKGEVA